jgi:hypothetical protein
MNLKLSKFLFKLILEKPINFNDLKDVDPILFKNLINIFNFNKFENLTFSIEEKNFKLNNNINLIENGNNINVNNENKLEYIKLITKYKLISSIKNQLKYILNGIFEIIPKNYFKIFNENELELILCNNYINLNVEDLINSTIYIGFNENDKFIKLFWKIINEFKKFLIFLKINDEDELNEKFPNFTISKDINKLNENNLIYNNFYNKLSIGKKIKENELKIKILNLIE